ncbi:MAG: hypothetical protein D6790_00365 [Caldilineae bacterium]|nr:MAG: hypothetical protein D6790_00365 [Caldilineae bacterium]
MNTSTTDAQETTSVPPVEEAPARDVQTPPPPPLGPSTWNFLYYGILVISFLIGLLTLLSGGQVFDALVRFFVALFGLSFLTIIFLVSVVIPLHVRRYERLVEAQKAALEAERQRQEQLASQQEEAPFFSAQTTGAMPAQDDSPLAQREAENHVLDEHGLDDQASSLRRMVANA